MTLRAHDRRAHNAHAQGEQMKQVFSLKKFIEVMIPFEDEKSLVKSLKLWALCCEGKTVDEMARNGYLCSGDWLVEVED